MTRDPPRSPLTDTLVPYTTLFRSAGIRNVVPARLARRHDLAFNAALTEAARHEDRVHALQDARRFGFDRFGFDVADLDARAGMQTGVMQRFIQRLVGIC